MLKEADYIMENDIYAVHVYAHICIYGYCLMVYFINIVKSFFALFYVRRAVVNVSADRIFARASFYSTVSLS